MILGCLHSTTLRAQSKCLGRRTQLPIRPPTTPKREYWLFSALLREIPKTTPMGEDGLFTALRRAISKTKARESRNNVWMLEDIWRLVVMIVSMRQDPARNQGLLQHLSHQITARLKEYNWRQMETSRVDIEALLALHPPISKEAWHRMKGWYKS